MSDLSLSIAIKATDAASGIFSNIASKLKDINPVAGVAAAAVIGIGAAAVGLGVESVKAAGNFEQAMLSNVAHAGLAKNQIDSVSQSVLNMSTVVGRSPTELAEALYPILSAFSGIQNQSAKSALALSTLKLSFEAVAGTTVNGTDVANAAVGTFNALGLATNNASTNASRMKNLFDVMDLTVQEGNMQWDAYKNVISKLAVSIQGTSVKFNEASSALATLTNEGMSAQKAQTYLSNLFTTMAIKTDTLAAHAKKLKISFDEQKYSSMNLADKIAYLNEVTGGNKQKILALLGNNATALKAFNALSTGVKSYQENLNNLNHAQGALKTSFDTASQGFNFQMSQIKAAGSALMVTIGEKLLPIVSKLAAQVAPLITQFSAWLIKSGALQNIASGLSNGLASLVTGITKAVQIVQQLTSFFQHNQLAMAALKGVLIAVAGAILASMVVAFYAWATAAAAAAIATLAATWPILAIGAAIALVVTGIILAIQHWGAIMAWLKGIWAAFSSWFMSLLNTIGTFFKGLWNGITSFFKQAWAVILSIAKVATLVLLALIIGPIGLLVILIVTHWKQITAAFSSAMSAIRNVVSGAITWLKNAWQNCVNAIVGAFSWLYNHNYYFKDLVDAIRNVFNTFKSWVAAFWNAEVQGWTRIWNMIKGIATALWNDVKNIFNAAFEWIAGIAVAFWNTEVNGWTRIWNAIKAIVTSLWNDITHVFSSAWNGISSALSGIWNNLSGWFSNLANQALSWGGNFIKMLAQGITNAAGAVVSAAKNVAGNIAKFLGFHSPTEQGPAADSDTWGPNFVKMFSQGVIATLPQITDAATQVANAMQPMYARGSHHTGTTHHHTGTHHTTHHKAPATPYTGPNVGTGMANLFNTDLSKNHNAAQHILSSLTQAIQADSENVLKLHVAGNKIAEANLRKKLDMENAQFRLYKDMLKQHGDKLKGNTIQFLGMSPVKAPGSGSGTGLSGGGGSGSSSGAQYITININNTFNVPMGTDRRQAKAMAEMVEKELTNWFRQQGSYTTTSSGTTG